MHTLTRQQVRQVDRLAIEALGIPGVVLMENAGRNATRVILDLIRNNLGLYQSRSGLRGPVRPRQGNLGRFCDSDAANSYPMGITPDSARVVVLAGSGNNGGDGYVIARHLHNQAVGVAIYTTADPAQLKGDAAINHAICDKMGLAIHRVGHGQALADQAAAWGRAHVVVDALLGTGFMGSIRPALAKVIESCNTLRGPKVVAIDIPSGLDCDTGRPSNATIRADLTVTFVATKPGLANPAAQAYVGQVVVVDIGCPPQLIREVLGQPG